MFSRNAFLPMPFDGYCRHSYNTPSVIWSLSSLPLLRYPPPLLFFFLRWQTAAFSFISQRTDTLDEKGSVAVSSISLTFVLSLATVPQLSQSSFFLSCDNLYCERDGRFSPLSRAGVNADSSFNPIVIDIVLNCRLGPHSLVISFFVLLNAFLPFGP